MLDFAERTGSSIIIVVWSFFLSMAKMDPMMSPPLPAKSQALSPQSNGAANTASSKKTQSINNYQ